MPSLNLSMRFVVTILLFLFLISVLDTQAQRQGIRGEVFWISGNQMPSPKGVQDPEQGIIREILFYTITRMQDVDQVSNGFFTNIRTTLIAKTLSTTDGSFSIKLPPGEYSVFVKESNGLFANLFDKENKINPVVVKPKQYAWVTITVDYESVN